MDNQMNQQAEQGSTLKDEAMQLGSKAGEKLATAVDDRKHQAVDPLKQVAGAVEAARDSLAQSDSPASEWLTRGLGQVATYVTDFAETIQTRNSSELARDVQQFARTNPTAFLGACAAAGFAAARVLRAGATSADQATATPPSQDSWSDQPASIASGTATSDTNPMGVGAGM